MLADLHIHSKYSSHALYVNNRNIMRKIEEKYDSSEVFSDKPTILQKLIIDGTSHIRDILKIAKRRGIQCIAITDHNTTIGSLEAQSLAKEFDIIVVPGMELSTDSGEILCYGIMKKIEKGLPINQAIDEVHKQGGIVIAAHPFHRRHPNIDFRRIDQELLSQLQIDGIEVFNPITGKTDMKFLSLAKENNWCITGGSDAHVLYQIGKGVTVIPNTCKTWQDVILAIKNHETYATGTKLNYFRMFLNTLWVNTIFGRKLISRKWVSESKE